MIGVVVVFDLESKKCVTQPSVPTVTLEIKSRYSLCVVAKIPPVADGFPLVGSLVSLVQDAEAFFQAQYHKHGSCYRIQVLGSEFLVRLQKLILCQYA